MSTYKPLTQLLAAATVSVLLASGCSSSNSSSDDGSSTSGDTGGGTTDSGTTDSGTTGVGTTDVGATDVGTATTGGATENPGAALNLDRDGFTLIEALGGYGLDLLGETVALVGVSAQESAIGSVSELPGSFTVVDRADENVNVPINVTRYSCQLGGELVLEQGIFIENDSDYSRTIERTEYRFDQCRLNIDGEQTLNGTMDTSDDRESASRSSYQERNSNWSDFSWIKDSGAVWNVSAAIRTYNFESFDSNSSRVTTINRYESTQDDVIVESIIDGDFSLVFSTSAAGGIEEYSLTTNGRYTNGANVPVSITTNTPMKRKLISQSIEGIRVPFNGKITMTADNGSQLVLDGVPSSVTGELQVDSTYQDSEGNVTTVRAKEFVDLVVNEF